MDEAAVPKFEASPEQMIKIRTLLDNPDVPDETTEPFVQPPPRKKRRHVGRPSNKEREAERREALGLPPVDSEPVEMPLAPAKLSKKSEQEVSERLTNMLMAATGIASQAKDYLAMTEEEAKAISDPLASYLTRNADTIVVAQQILENYDLLAIVLGVLAYTVRIYRDRVTEIEQQRKLRPVTNPSPFDRVLQHTEPSDNGTGPTEGDANILGGPYGTGEWNAS